MIKNLVAVAVLIVAVTGVAFAGGDLEPTPQIVERPVAKKPVVRVPTKVVAAPVVTMPEVDVRSHALFLGSIADRELSGFDNFGDIEWDEAGYVMYSPVVSGISPVLGVIFGDAEGFIAGAGYGFANKVKAYAALNTNGEEYFGGDRNTGAQAGVQVALPVGLALDLGVLAPEADRIGKSGGEAIPYVGVGYRF